MDFFQLNRKQLLKLLERQEKREAKKRAADQTPARQSDDDDDDDEGDAKLVATSRESEGEAKKSRLEGEPTHPTP